MVLDDLRSPRSRRRSSRWRRRGVYLLLAAAYGLQRTLQPAVLHLLPMLDGKLLQQPQRMAALQGAQLPLFAAAVLPAAIAAEAIGAAALLALSLAGSAAALLALPAVASRGSAAALSRLLDANSLLQGAVFPCIVALQARWIPRGTLDDIWASRTLGVGAVVTEVFVSAAPAACASSLPSHPHTTQG